MPTHPCAKNAATAKSLSLTIANRQATKTYLARVRGLFGYARPGGLRVLVSKARATCPASVLTFPEGGRYPSETIVRLVRADKSTSLVKCKSVTGRTHQIRLHLQLIGFPIANDPCYGGELHFGESAERVDEIAAAKRSKADLPPKDSVDYSTPRKENESEEEFMRRTCPCCYIGEAEAFNETQLHCSKIWLHALQYQLNGRVFTAPEPGRAPELGCSSEYGLDHYSLSSSCARAGLA
ncbi:unnamed protein product [Hyaloperonospora brassicae]|uniref:Pseudouridine synthase RsuA/RluA-like domain-containing protein n=1 Tax=Hyaloperonospora brassicae TaxID=162125 RepID=A0AAV0USN6_HYABA|nr:unnamed protein product [Hyaloperonospora brassicae]